MKKKIVKVRPKVKKKNKNMIYQSTSIKDIKTAPILVKIENAVFCKRQIDNS